MIHGLKLSERQLDTLARVVNQWTQNVERVLPYLEGRGLHAETAISCRLGAGSTDIPGWERFDGMLMIPYLIGADVVSIKFRRLGDDGPKYDQPGGQRPRLYGAGLLADGGPVVALCEGELDAILVRQEFGVPAVATPGSSHWARHYARCFANFDRLVVFADSDEAGMRHANRVVGLVDGAELVVPPKGLDVSEWVLRDGAAVVGEAAGL